VPRELRLLQVCTEGVRSLRKERRGSDVLDLQRIQQRQHRARRPFGGTLVEPLKWSSCWKKCVRGNARGINRNARSRSGY
jgi:hypothetical protein